MALDMILNELTGDSSRHAADFAPKGLARGPGDFLAGVRSDIATNLTAYVLAETLEGGVAYCAVVTEHGYIIYGESSLYMIFAYSIYAVARAPQGAQKFHTSDGVWQTTTGVAF